MRVRDPRRQLEGLELYHRGSVQTTEAVAINDHHPFVQLVALLKRISTIRLVGGQRLEGGPQVGLKIQ